MAGPVPAIVVWRLPGDDGDAIDMGAPFPPSPADCMKIPIQELPRTELPRSLIYVTAMTCGVLAAMTAQIVLARNGIEISAVWRNLLSAEALQLRSAGVWWLMAAAAFLGGTAVAGALSRLPWPWHRLRLVRWVLGAAIVFALAEAGHQAATASTQPLGAHLAVSLLALCAAALIAQFGAYFAVKR